MKTSLLFLLLILMVCALLAAWNAAPRTSEAKAQSPLAGPSRPAGNETAAGSPSGIRSPEGQPDHPVGTPLAGTGLEAAVDILLREAELMNRPGRKGGYGDHLDPRLEQALDDLSQPGSLAALSDALAHRLAKVSVALLDDPWALSDHRPADGGADLVRNHAVLLLEKLAGHSYGNLIRPGGDLPPGQPALDEDTKVVAAWRDWWQGASHTPRERWTEVP